MREPNERDPSFAAGREILDAWIPSDPAHPVHTAIRAAFIDRFALYYQGLNEVTKSRQNEASISPDELDRLDKECMQLAGLIFDRSNLWVARDWRHPAIVKFLVRALRRTRPGRPATKQQVAIQAKEMRLIDPKHWTWPKITAALCDCGKDHTIRCQDNLRREVLHLEKTMKKCGCKLVST